MDFLPPCPCPCVTLLKLSALCLFSNLFLCEVEGSLLASALCFFSSDHTIAYRCYKKLRALAFR